MPRAALLAAILVVPMPSAQADLGWGLGHAAAKRSARLINEAGTASTITPPDPNAPSTRLKWRVVGDPVYYSSPALAPGGASVYVGTTGHFNIFAAYWTQNQKPPTSSYGLYSYTTDGALEWKYADDAPIRGGPVVGPDGSIYVVMERMTTSEFGTTEELHAVTPQGIQKWKTTFCNRYSEIGALVPSVAADGTIYVGGTDLKAFQPDGTLKWTASLGASAVNNAYYAAPAIAADGTVYAMYWDLAAPTLRAYNPNGTEKWTSAAVMGTYATTASPSIANDGTIYVGNGAGNSATGGLLWAFNPNGTVKWSFAVQDFDLRSSPAVDADGTIYFGTKGNAGYVYAVNPDGTQKWRYATVDDAAGGGVDVYCSPEIASDGTLYIANEQGWLYAFNRDGTLRWKDNKLAAHGGFNWSSPVIASDGTLFIGSTYGTFMAVVTDSHGISTTAQWPKFRHDDSNSSQKL